MALESFIRSIVYSFIHSFHLNVFLWYFLFIFQIFRSLESPAEEDRARKLHENVVEQRAYFIGNLTQLMNMSDLRNRDRVISMHLENYEVVSPETRQDETRQ